MNRFPALLIVATFAACSAPVEAPVDDARLAEMGDSSDASELDGGMLVDVAADLARDTGGPGARGRSL